MRYTLALILLALLATNVPSKAQDAPVPLSLDDCMAYAMKHNYTVKNSRLDVLIQDAQNKQTISAAYPHISAKAELDDYLNPQQSLVDVNSFLGKTPPLIEKISFTLPYGGTGSVNGSQILFDGSVLVALQAQKTILEYARLNGEVSNETIRYNVYKAYNSLVIAYRQYDIIKSSLQYARQVEHDITVTQQSGFAERIDVERTSVQVNNLSTDSIKVSNMLNVSEKVLKYQMGMDINTPIVLIDTNVEANKNEVAGLLDEDEDYSRVPEYNFFNTQLKLNNYNVKRYQYAALPTLNLFAAAGMNYAAYRLTDMFTPNSYLFNSVVGLQLNVPIFNGFMRHNQVREARLNVEKSKNNISNIKLTIDFQVAQSRTTLKNTVLETRNQHRNLELANDVLDLAQRKYKAGVGSNLEVTQAQTDQLTAQNNYFNALLDLINAEADLKKALGLLK
ncbi:MAG: TolC family protein [Flavipsychrobacter sp.]|nr:TolC family protein [Flavipsychrobacter sp.]